MTTLLLGPVDSKVMSIIGTAAGAVVATAEKIQPAFIKEKGIDFIVSYGYRHIIKPDVLDLLVDRVVNLHISYLPWNRGADPNFWSFVEDSPKGVTIHYVDAGIDTGDIIAQKQLWPQVEDTMRTFYDRLHTEIVALFALHWPQIRAGTCPRIGQPKQNGSYHRSADKERLAHLLPLGWDTPVAAVSAPRPNSQEVTYG